MTQQNKLRTFSPEDIAGRCVLVRADLNVPIDNGVITNDFRIRRALPTIAAIIHGGGRVVLISHIGKDGQSTLRPVYHYLQQHVPIHFAKTLDEAERLVSSLKEGEVLLLENLRSNSGEVEADAVFAERLATLADVYVNDAFAASHRQHASIVGVPRLLPSFAGVEFMEEVTYLNTALTPASPSLLILGGAKFHTKIPLIKRLQHYDTIFIGGAIANDFFKAKGYEVGKSLVADDTKELLPLMDNKNLLLPLDVTVVREGAAVVVEPTEVLPDDVIVDVGTKTTDMLSSLASHAATVLWNGPLGNYEKGFSNETELLAKAVASSSAISIVGGGDTIASIGQLKLEDKFTFLSTGGGAMLDYLAEGTLVGLEALVHNN